MLYPKECRLTSPLVFDTHAHYDDKRFDECRNELLGKLFSNGICGIVSCGCDYESSKKAIEIAEGFDGVYAAAGIHPECRDSGTTVEQIRELLAHKKCVAVGEIGLDYYWSKDKAEQIKVFEQQLTLANELDMPVLVHDREAHADTLFLLQKHRPKGVVHCFSGSPETAREIVKLGMYIGVGGVATFKNAKRLPEVIEQTPIERILLETDAPYLAPVPYRGKVCHSGFIPLVAEKIAEIKGLTRDEVLIKTQRNAKKLFDL